MFKDKEFYKKLRELMIPIAFQSFMLAAVSAGDSAMLGFVDENAMAAVSLAGNIQFVENLFLAAVVCGATILTAQYWGKGDKGMVERIFGLILRYALVISAVFCFAAFVVPEQMMRIFTNEPELIALGGEYIKIAALSQLEQYVATQIKPEVPYELYTESEDFASHRNNINRWCRYRQ